MIQRKDLLLVQIYDALSHIYLKVKSPQYSAGRDAFQKRIEVMHSLLHSILNWNSQGNANGTLRNMFCFVYSIGLHMSGIVLNCY